jgi:hypothetical protein
MTATITVHSAVEPVMGSSPPGAGELGPEPGELGPGPEIVGDRVGVAVMPSDWWTRLGSTCSNNPMPLLPAGAIDSLPIA